MAEAAGLSVDTYSPGDGVTRYRFFPFPEGDYFAHSHKAAGTVKGLKRAFKFLAQYGRGGNPPMLILGNPEGKGYYAHDTAKLWDVVKIGRSKFRAIGRDPRGVMLWKGSGPTIYVIYVRSAGDWASGSFTDAPHPVPVAQQFSRMSREIKRHIRAQQRGGNPNVTFEYPSGEPKMYSSVTGGARRLSMGLGLGAPMHIRPDHQAHGIEVSLYRKGEGTGRFYATSANVRDTGVGAANPAMSVPPFDLPTLDRMYSEASRKLEAMKGTPVEGSPEYMATLYQLRNLTRARLAASGVRIKGVGPNPASGPADPGAVTELVLFIDNERSLSPDSPENTQGKSIVANLYRKWYAGKYDREKAVTLWMYLMDTAARMYTDQFGTPGAPIDVIFNKNTRLAAARQYRDDFEQKMASGEYPHVWVRSVVPKKYHGKLPAGNPRGRRELSVFDKHQLRIARDTLRMDPRAAAVMGGPSPEEAREIIYRLTGKWPEGEPRPTAGNPDVTRLDDAGLRSTFSWQTKHGMAPKWGSTSIQYYQMDQFASIDIITELAALAGADPKQVRVRQGMVVAKAGKRWVPLQMVHVVSDWAARRSRGEKFPVHLYKPWTLGDPPAGFVRGGNPSDNPRKRSALYGWGFQAGVEAAEANLSDPPSRAELEKYAAQDRIGEFAGGIREHQSQFAGDVAYELSEGKLSKWEEGFYAGFDQTVRAALGMNPGTSARGVRSPWAVCTAAVGRKDRAKYERCVRAVKARGGNPGVPPAISNDPRFKKALKLYRKMHGNGPVEIRRVKVPKGFPKFLVSYGKAPHAVYDAAKRSNKGKRIHQFGEGGGSQPWLVTAPGREKFLSYVGGTFKAKEWIYK
jgi:hypothetical protein